MKLEVRDLLKRLDQVNANGAGSVPVRSDEEIIAGFINALPWSQGITILAIS